MLAPAAPSFDLAPALADPDAAVVLCRVEALERRRVEGMEERGEVALQVVDVLAAGPPLEGSRLVVPFSRATEPPRDGGDAWDRVALTPDETLVLAVGAGADVIAVTGSGGAQDPMIDDVRRAARLARGPLDAEAVVPALAGAESLPREALIQRLARFETPAPTAVDLLARALAAAGPERRARLRLALDDCFDPDAWASRTNAQVLTALARELLTADRAERPGWVRALARWLRYPYDPAPERQERVARALVLLVDAPPVAMVAALEGLGGAGTPEDQAAARDVLALWLQL